MNPITLIDPTGEFEESYDQNSDIVGGTVQKGDSLSQIIQDRVRGNDSSGRVKSLTDRVAKANNIKNPDLIMPGQNIDLSSIKNDINPASGALADPGLIDPSAFIGAGLAAGLLRAFGIGVVTSSAASSQASTSAASRGPISQLFKSMGSFENKGVLNAVDKLKNSGFVFKGRTPGGYYKYYHPNGARVQIRPNGQIYRYSKGGLKYNSAGESVNLHGQEFIFNAK